MIDTATIERYMRDANPIPHIDDVDPDEFARFVAAAQTRRAAIMQAPTQHPITPPTSPPPLRRKAWAFAAAFILMLASIGIAALVLRGDGAPVTDEPAPPTTVAETLGETTDVESLTWSRVPYDEAVFGLDQTVFGERDRVEIHDVTAGGPGLVAVGEAGGDAAVWTSPDGYTWSRIRLTFADHGDSAIKSVTRGGPGLVAVGYSGQNLDAIFVEEFSEGGSAVWTSTDGLTWSRIDLLDEPAGGMEYVTTWGPGLIAHAAARDSSGVWTSADGISWQQIPVFNDVEDGGPGLVIAGGPGLVGVGGGWEAGYASTSPDGTTWSQSLLPLDETHGDPIVVDTGGITVGGPGFVAVGTVQPCGEVEACAVVWTSPDGYTWSLVPLDDEQSADVQMNDVAATETGLVAVGGTHWGLAAVWTSPDGITWSRAPLEESVADGDMRSVTVGGPGLVAVGSFYVPTGHDAPDFLNVGAVWIAEP